MKSLRPGLLQAPVRSFLPVPVITHPARPLSTSLISLNQNAPLDRVSQWLHPIKYMKWKMNQIDNARSAYELCSVQFEKNPDFVNKFGLQDNFQSWFSVTVLHLWAYNARLRAEGPDGKDMKQEIFNHLWMDVEIKLHQAGVKQKVGQIISDLLSAYYGQTLAYDEGLYRGDAVLASALWRNVFASQDADIQQLSAFVRYVRENIVMLNEASKNDQDSMPASASFRSSTFDPVLIIAQIVSLQCLYYLSISLIVLALEVLTGAPVTLNHVLYYPEIRTDTVLGWTLFIAFLMNAALGHRIPTNFFWWFLFAATLLIMSLGGEYLCMQKELEPIVLTGQKKRGSVRGEDEVELQRLNNSE
ncbi:hypothetical protein HK102_008624 [Quaeritorhiza haematococci]|nr:hypothetical protein HK102_008624 [Quaeritorhiza haematococci]